MVQDKEAMKCNLCELELEVDSKSPFLLEHLKEMHVDIYDLHKHNPQATVGFRVRYDGEIDKTQPIILEEVCASDRAETLVAVESVISQEPESDVINMQYVMLDTKRKHRKSSGHEARRRSWIWKYFDRLSNIVYRCNVCNVVLSTKGSNTNNLNRHMRTKHPDIFKTETLGEAIAKDDLDKSEVETPYAITTEEIIYSDSESPSQKARRSWIWSYFDYKTASRAQCKLCRRQINHGGNATGNMNRHLKMIHHKTSPDEKGDISWIWKVFEQDTNFYTCKICQHKLCRNNSDGDIPAITNHLKKEHGVVSGDQIITGSDCDLEEN